MHDGNDPDLDEHTQPVPERSGLGRLGARETTAQLRLSMPPAPTVSEVQPDLDDWSETTNVELPLGAIQAPTLPFAQAAVPPPRPSYPYDALPFAQAAVPPPRPSYPYDALPSAPAAVPPPPVASPSPASLPAASFTAPAVAPFSLEAASNAAARADQAAEEKKAAGGAPAKPEALRRRAVVDLLFFEPRIVPRLRAMKRLGPLWTQAARPRVQSVDEPRRDLPDRADVLRVLCFGRPESAAAIRRALAEGLDDPTDLDPPLVLVGGELRPTFDEIETLRTSVAVAQPVAGADKKVLTAIAIAEEALGTAIGPRPDAAIGLARQVEANTAALSLPPRYVATQVERALIEGRKWKRRTLLGAPRIRADLALTGGEALPLYLPDSIAGSLPLLPAFPIVAICEARPREDGGEAQAEALFAVAVGRVLHARTD